MVRLIALVASLPLFFSLVVVVTPQERLTNRILFVVDVSGSMRGDKFSSACSAVLRIAEQPVDEVQIGVVAFNDRTVRWDGIPEAHDTRPVPKGWAGLPSEDAVKQASAFLAGLGAGGDTLFIPALREALREERRNVSLVLVTDGIFQRESNREVLEALRAGQKEREEKDLGRAVVLVYGIGGEARILREIGGEGRGGYYRERQLTPRIQGMWR